LERKCNVYNAVGGVCGVSAEGVDRGTILWRTLDWSPATVAASPLYLGNNEIAVLGSYGAGGAKIKISKTSAGFEASVTDAHRQQKDWLAISKHRYLKMAIYGR